jgi:hypothetical protein
MAHPPASSVILQHPPASSIIIHHHPSSSIILYHPPSSSIILLHLPSSSIIIHHPPSSSTILHHPPSSSIILHHPPSSSIILHHPPPSIIHRTASFCVHLMTPRGKQHAYAILNSVVPRRASEGEGHLLEDLLLAADVSPSVYKSWYRPCALAYGRGTRELAAGNSTNVPRKNGEHLTSSLSHLALSPPVFLDGLYVMLCSTSGFGFHVERRLPPAS